MSNNKSILSLIFNVFFFGKIQTCVTIITAINNGEIMGKTKKVFLSIVSILILSVCLLCGCRPTPKEKPDINIGASTEVKNLIYIIGDGMGSNHIANTKTYYNKTFNFEQYYVTDITTYSRNDTVTDSAAAGTALATGKKTDNGVISRIDKKDVTNLMEVARSKNKRTGVVTTDYLSGATPACFSAHANNRGDKDDIIKCQYGSNIDLLIGKQDTQYYVEKYGEKFKANGYNIYTDYNSLKIADKNRKILASLDGLYSQYTLGLTNTTNYSQLLEFVLDYMDYNNENGFCLMVEEAYIDKNSHSNNILGMMSAMMNIGEGIDYILDWCKDRTDTAIIFTADHETGKLDKANTRKEIDDSLNSKKTLSSLYHKKSHTARNVPLYLYNIDFTYDNEKTVDNTQVYDIAYSLITK